MRQLTTVVLFALLSVALCLEECNTRRCGRHRLSRSRCGGWADSANSIAAAGSGDDSSLSFSGPTGRCVRESGSHDCHWEVAFCPPHDNPCRPNPCGSGEVCVAEPKVCVREPCYQYRCDPAPCDCSDMAHIMISFPCWDGSWVGYTECARNDYGECGWQLAECPMPSLTCANVLCMVGTTCEMVNGEPQCLPIHDECHPNPCPAHEQCWPDPKECVTTPCPQHRCECDCSDMASIQIVFPCWDGSWVGYTKCGRRADGGCGLSLAECPPQPGGEPGECTDAECGPMLLIAKLCPDGSTVGMTECHRNSDGVCERSFAECPDSECDISDCGPPLGMPNVQCADGSIAGPSGRCIRVADGCGWEVLSCPEEDPCASNPCGGGQTCFPEPKRCLTTSSGDRCPQYRCECTDCGLPIDVLYMCADGTITHAGTECALQEDNTCDWNIIPPPCNYDTEEDPELTCETVLMLCADGTACSMVDGVPTCTPIGDVCDPNPCPSGKTCRPADFTCQCVDCNCQPYICENDCTESECGAHTMEAVLCPDGSYVGYTVCGRNADGQCQWSMAQCPLPTLTCATVLCMAGTTCSMVDGRPQCLPICDCSDMVAIQIAVSCWDGSWVGYTKCGRNENGECALSLADCPPQPSTATCANVRCMAGTTCSMVDGHPQCLPDAECDCSDMVAITIAVECWDGSYVGYTECGRDENGECALLLADCPPQPEECDCSGMAAIAIAFQCEDGSWVGYTKCSRGSDGECGLSLADCPEPCTNLECGPMPLIARLCPDGSSVGMTLCQRDEAGVCRRDFPECPSPTEECDCSDMVAIEIAMECPDGSYVGYTKCARDDNGQCALMLADCPPAQTTSCAAVLCLVGSQCQVVDGVAQCVPNGDACDSNPCPSGQRCEPMQVSCLCVEGVQCECPQYICTAQSCGDFSNDEEGCTSFRSGSGLLGGGCQYCANGICQASGTQCASPSYSCADYNNDEEGCSSNTGNGAPGSGCQFCANGMCQARGTLCPTATCAAVTCLEGYACEVVDGEPVCIDPNGWGPWGECSRSCGVGRQTRRCLRRRGRRGCSGPSWKFCSQQPCGRNGRNGHN